MPNNPVSVYTAVRQILTENPNLTADEVIPLARAKGVTDLDTQIRKAIHSTRTDLKRKKKRAAKKGGQSLYTVMREILRDAPELATDEVISQARAKGVTATDEQLKEAIRRSRHVARKATPAAPAAARTTTESKVPADPTAPASDLDVLFANVSLANRTAHLCGGVSKAREIAEGIRASGGLDAFLKCLTLLADVLGSDTAL